METDFVRWWVNISLPGLSRWTCIFTNIVKQYTKMVNVGLTFKLPRCSKISISWWNLENHLIVDRYKVEVVLTLRKVMVNAAM